MVCCFFFKATIFGEKTVYFYFKNGMLFLICAALKDLSAELQCLSSLYSSTSLFLNTP